MTEPLAWGAKVSATFRRRVREITADWYEGAASDLMACIAFETGETFSPSVKNPGSSATGLIQFMEATARGLGTTTRALAQMSAEQQLDYVAKYFKPYGPRLHSRSDMYMAILMPKYVGAPGDTPVMAGPSAAYRANKGLDTNLDGVITKDEATAFVDAKLEKGLRAGYVWRPPEPAAPVVGSTTKGLASWLISLVRRLLAR